MKKSNISFMFILFFVFSGSFFVHADTRKDPVDVFLVLDKSLSMVEEIDAVKEYVNTSIIDDFLIDDDFLVVIQFYGNAQPLIQNRIGGPADKEALKVAISEIMANGRYTDIGNALDTLRQALDTHPETDRRVYLLLITDGIQEAPPDSVYYSPDGSFNHAFLEHTKTILKKGWKIQILGIGSDTAAEDVARELSGGYVEITEATNAEDIRETVGEIFGVVEASAFAVSPIRDDGSAVVSLKVTVSGYNEEVKITVSDILFDIPGYASLSTLQEPVVLLLPPDETSDVEFPVRFDSPEFLKTVQQSGEVRFQFTGSQVFVPAYFTVSLDRAGFLAQRLWLIPVVLGAAALLVLAVVLLRRRTPFSRGLQFTCELSADTEVKKKISLKNGESCYILNGPMGLTISTSRTGKICAEMKAVGEKLQLSVLDEIYFRPFGRIPDNLMDTTLKFFRENGTYGSLTISGMSP